MSSRRGRQRSVVAGLAMTVTIVLVAAGAPVGPASGASTSRTVAPVGHAAASVAQHGQVQAPAGLRGVIATAGNYGHSLALRADGAVFAWGFNYFGQLGTGLRENQATPTRVCAIGHYYPCTQYLENAVAIAAGERHSLALLRDGTVVSWGTYFVWDGVPIDPFPPLRVCLTGGPWWDCEKPLTGVRAIAAGSFHSMALLHNGTVFAWGDNGAGQLGDGTGASRFETAQVCAVGEVTPCGRILTGVRAISAGAWHSMALLGNGTVLAWGDNGYGQLGDGNLGFRLTPVRVCAVEEVAPCDRHLGGVRALSAGHFHSMALLNNNALVAWGWNYHGQLGDGTRDGRLTPVRVCAVGETAPCDRFLAAVRSVSAGYLHSTALLGDLTVTAWGDNASGQLGDGTTTDHLTPVRVCAVGEVAPCGRVLRIVRAIGVGQSHNLAVLNDLTVVAWGVNYFGQLGDGTRTTRLTPVRVLAPQT